MRVLGSSRAFFSSFICTECQLNPLSKDRRLHHSQQVNGIEQQECLNLLHCFLDIEGRKWQKTGKSSLTLSLSLSQDDCTKCIYRKPYVLLMDVT